MSNQTRVPTTKKVLAGILSALLAIGSVPAPVLANEIEEVPIVEQAQEGASADEQQEAPSAAPGTAEEEASAPEAAGDEEAGAIEEDVVLKPQIDLAEFELVVDQVGPYACGTCTWSISATGVLTVRPTTGSEGTLANWGSNTYDCPPWHEHASHITGCALEGRIYAPTCRSMFRDCTNIKALDLSRLDTSQTTSMDYMFHGCSSLATINTSGWDTQNVTSMDRMFRKCTALTGVDVANWDTSRVQNMCGMFDQCAALKSLDVSRWDTSQVTTMGHESEFSNNDPSDPLFYERLQQCGMFSGCSSLTTLDVSNWDVSKVSYFGVMFLDCESLKKLDVSRWDTSNAYNMSSVFQNCSSVTSLDISGWNVSNLTFSSIYSLFKDCRSLKTLNLSGLDTSKLSTLSDAFTRCSSLSTVHVGEGYQMKSADFFPDATASNGMWYSTADKCWYTKDYIVSSRSQVRDTYTSTASIAGASASCSPAACTFTGKALKPSVKATLGATTLTQGVDFTVAYKNNVNAGTATATITGKGLYTGTKTVSFKINRASLAKAALGKVANQAYTGKAVKPRPAVKVGSTTLALNRDYTLSYKNSVKAGAATVTAKGKGNYAGSKSVKFKIVAPSVLYHSYLQGSGNQGWKKNGQVSGNTGAAKRLEGVWMKLGSKPVSGSIQYNMHVQSIGWQGWRSEGKASGLPGKGKRIEAVMVRLTGNMAKKYDVYYRVYAQRFGWMGWAKNGAKAGTAGFGYRIEAIQVVLLPKGSKAPAANYQGQRRATAQAFRKK